jgi:hypothetical protein
VTLATRDDLVSPNDAAKDVLVIDFAGFQSESFQLDSASRFVSEAVRLGWRNLIGYGFIGDRATWVRTWRTARDTRRAV